MARARIGDLSMDRARLHHGLLVALALWTPPLAAAQVGPKSASDDEAHAEPLPGMETFIDGVVEGFAPQHIAGVQVAIVKDARVLLVKGYGIAKLRPERAVDPTRTLFRLASITKTFTWIALMQLEERGLLRLSDPVNLHLPPELAIPNDGFEQPIRILDLMNHTAGFEDVNQEPDLHDDASLRTLQQTLDRYRPERVRRPGVVSVYSNYGAALAGAIIGHVTGSDYETYIEQRLLRPLELEHTTVRDSYGSRAPRGLPAPMAPNLEAERAAGIEWEDGAWRAFASEHRLFVSAGAGSSTARDIARYMLALLDPAVLEHAGVLKASTFARMKEQSFQPAPGLPGIHHGFFDEPVGTSTQLGYTNVSHSGFVDHFASHMSLFPELGLGIFVSTNSSSGGKLAAILPELILRRYFPPQAQRSPATTAANASLSEYAGTYRPMRRNYSKLEAAFSLDSSFEIAASHDGQLICRNRSGNPVRYVQIGHDLFQRVDGDARIAFMRDPRGNIVRVVGAITAERMRLIDTAWWFRGWLVLGLVVSLVTAWRFRGWRRKLPSAHTLFRRTDQWTKWTVSLWLAMYAAAMTWQLRCGFGKAFQDYPQPVLKLTLWLLMAAVAATGVALLLLPITWLRTDWSRGRRARHTLLLALYVMVSLAFHHWNVIGLHYY